MIGGDQPANGVVDGGRAGGTDLVCAIAESCEDSRRERSNVGMVRGEASE